jgi:hypothetical protein
VVTFKLLPLYQQYSFNRGLSRLTTGLTTAAKRRLTARLQGPIITAVARLTQAQTVTGHKQNEK